MVGTHASLCVHVCDYIYLSSYMLHVGCQRRCRARCKKPSMFLKDEVQRYQGDQVGLPKKEVSTGHAWEVSG